MAWFQGNLDGVEYFLISRAGAPGEVLGAGVQASIGHLSASEGRLMERGAAGSILPPPEDPELPTAPAVCRPKDSASCEQRTGLLWKPPFLCCVTGFPGEAMEGVLDSKEMGWLQSERDWGPGGPPVGNGPAGGALRQGLAQVLSVTSCPLPQHPWQDKWRASQATAVVRTHRLQ